MSHRRPVALAALTLAAATSCLVAAPAHASAAPATCLGKPVTVVATTTVTQGTEGDDVVAMEPDAWNRFEALGGNDTICLAQGAGHPNDRDPIPPNGTLDAGPGDDSVVNLTPTGTTGIHTTVVLGLGNDTFVGSDVGEVVFADLREGDLDDPDVVDPTLVGPQRDVVTGAATVHTTAPADGVNADRVTLGGRGVRMVVAGPMGPQGLLDLSEAPDPVLEVRSPGRLGAPASSEVVVDNRSRQVTVDGRPALTWVGSVETFFIGAPRRLVAVGPAVGFEGTDSDEAITFADVPVADVRLGGGQDSMTVQSWNNAFVPQSADGGPGRDVFGLDNVCYDLVVRLGSTTTCNGIDSDGSLAGFEEVVVSGGTPAARAGVVRLVGTSRGERLVASGQLVAVRGGGGADEIGVDDSYRARVFAGSGTDGVRVSGDDVVVRGQGGKDRIRLLGTAGLRPVGDPGTRQQVALGGDGRDVLIGTTGNRDRLVGGPGKDRADGRRGRRDFCAAEVTRRCERPR